jgi:hypothetical protein
MAETLNIGYLHSPFLSGATSGIQFFGVLVQNLPPEPPRPTPLFLEFKDVTIATSSFLRESILPFRDFVRSRSPNFYPVIANPNQDVQDEFEDLMHRQGDVFLFCNIDLDLNPSAISLFGELDPKQKITFDLVHKHGQMDARGLMQKYGDGEGVKHATAWNNRLASLAAAGILVEIRNGRAKAYRPLFNGA